MVHTRTWMQNTWPIWYKHHPRWTYSMRTLTCGGNKGQSSRGRHRANQSCKIILNWQTSYEYVMTQFNKIKTLSIAYHQIFSEISSTTDALIAFLYLPVWLSLLWASLCWVSPWHPGDETAKELLSQGLGQTAASQRGLVYDHRAVEQVSTEKQRQELMLRQNEMNTESTYNNYNAICNTDCVK